MTVVTMMILTAMSMEATNLFMLVINCTVQWYTTYFILYSVFVSIENHLSMAKFINWK